MNIPLKSPLEYNTVVKILGYHQRKPKAAKHRPPSSISWRIWTRKLNLSPQFTSRAIITIQMTINTQPSITIRRRIQQTSTIATRSGKICKPKISRIRINIQHSIRNILVINWTPINTSQTQPKETSIIIISPSIPERKWPAKMTTGSAHRKLLQLSCNPTITHLVTTLQLISILPRRNTRSIVGTN